MAKHGYLSFLIDPDDRAKLARLAATKGYAVSEMARMCLRAGLKLAEDFAPKATDHAVTARRQQQRDKVA